MSQAAAASAPHAASGLGAVHEVAEKFLEEERANSGTRFDPVDRARFHRLIRLSAENWGRHPQTSCRMSRGKQGLTLFFEGPMSGKVLTLFTMKVDYKKGEYRFHGPAPDRHRADLSDDAKEALERLRALYAALLANEAANEDPTITRVLEGKPFPDLVPLVEESRRILDGGYDGAQPPPNAARRASRARAEAGENGAGGPESAEGSAVETITFGETRLLEVILYCPEPKESAAFYRRVFGVKSIGTQGPHDHAIYEMGPTRLVLREDFDSDERRLLGLGQARRHRGWGLHVVLQIPEYQACLRRVKRIPDALVQADPEHRRMVIRDPAGYLIELAESVP